MFASATIVLNPLKKTHSVCAQQVAHEIRELSIASVMTIWPGGITYSNVLPLHVESHRSGTQSHTHPQHQVRSLCPPSPSASWCPSMTTSSM